MKLLVRNPTTFETRAVPEAERFAWINLGWIPTGVIEDKSEMKGDGMVNSSSGNRRRPHQVRKKDA